MCMGNRLFKKKKKKIARIWKCFGGIREQKLKSPE